MLNVFDQRFRQQPLEGDIKLLAEEHGLHRWQKGYVLAELLSEMQHLNRIMLNEFRQYWQHYPTQEIKRIVESYEYLAWFYAQSMDGSVGQYTELQRVDASGRALTLQKTLDDLNEMTRQRGDLLRTASHDLRGSFGVIQGAATYLNMYEADETERKQMLEMLSRNLTTVRDMVIQLMDLARLEAGQELVSIKSFNAGQLLNTLVESYQPLAVEVGLILKADGPSDLEVESDPLQLQRIVQNLVLNALKHTQSGWVSVSWARESDYRWVVSVQDSGPGLPNQSESSLSQVLAPTPESAAAFGVFTPESDAREAEVTQAVKSNHSKGEGIGLSIVKRLCEILRAGLEIETKEGQGTLFRIRLAIHWKA
jgi:signal transduction histidine kinase